jgi:hypothetical protein
MHAIGIQRFLVSKPWLISVSRWSEQQMVKKPFLQFTTNIEIKHQISQTGKFYLKQNQYFRNEFIAVNTNIKINYNNKTGSRLILIQPAPLIEKILADIGINIKKMVMLYEQCRLKILTNEKISHFSVQRGKGFRQGGNHTSSCTLQTSDCSI